MKYSKIVENVLDTATKHAKKNKDSLLTSRHILLAISFQPDFITAFESLDGDIIILRDELINDLIENQTSGSKLELSDDAKNVIILAEMDSFINGFSEVNLANLLVGVLINPVEDIKEYFESQDIDILDLMKVVQKPFIKEKQKQIDESIPWKKFVKNLRNVVKEKPEPLIGREQEIDDTIRILCRKQKCNPLHIGEPGVGKTTITLGLAKLINEDNVPLNLKDNNLYSLDLASLVAGTKYRGEFEQRFKMVLEGLEKEKNSILYIDEIHSIIGAGNSEGSMDAANLLKETLVAGKIKFIGATTYDEYKKYFQKDKALDRRFKPIDVVESTPNETIKILNGLKKYYEDFHNVIYTPKAINTIVDLSVKYINDRFLPDKAIDIMDEAGAYLAKNIKTASTKKQKVTDKTIEYIISTTCKIPLKTLSSSESTKILTMEDELKKNIYGQDIAISQTINAIKLNRAGLSNTEKPIASLLYVGPTGVGKTEIAKQIANLMGISLIRYDMSEFKNENDVAKLIGSPQGYVGYEEGGRLIDDIRKHPNCVLLLDEIEKAHPTIFDLLLQVMDYATLTDSHGRKASFKNVLLIMTSNAGATHIKTKGLGFGSNLETINTTAMTDAIKTLFRPEFITRLTKIIEFNSMDEKMGALIVEKNLKDFVTLLKEKNITLNYSNEVIEYVKRKGITTEYGAREITNVIENELKPLFVDDIISGKLKAGSKCFLDIEHDIPVKK